MNTELTTNEQAELARHERVIEAGLGSFVTVGLALMAIRDDPHKLYRAYGTFDQYCRLRWKIERTYAHRLIEGARIVQNVAHGQQIEGPKNERQVRELAKLDDPEEQVEAWQRAFEESDDGVVTAAHVKEVVTDIKRQKRIKEDAPMEAPLAYLLLQGDFRDQADNLKDESIDLIVTDPPYPEQYLGLYDALGALGARVLKPGGSLLAMSGQSFLPSVVEQLGRHLAYRWTLAYMLPGGTTQLWERKVLCRWKPVLWYVKGEYKGEWVDDVCTSPRQDKANHHWGQSEAGMVDIIRRFSGNLILDPMCGAGTTGVAALALGRQFIGIDCDPEALKVAASRLAEANEHRET